MKVYRALRRLSIGVVRNEAFLAYRLKPENARILLRKGIIANVEMPPLDVMMPEHAEAFAEMGVTTFEQLFDSELVGADVKAKALDIFQPETECAICAK